MRCSIVLGSTILSNFPRAYAAGPGERSPESSRGSVFCFPRDRILSRSAVFLVPARYCWRGRVGCEAPVSCIALIRSIAPATCFPSPIINGSWPSPGVGPIRCLFERKSRNARVDPWLQIHQGRAAEVGRKLGGPYRLANCRRGGVSRKCSRILRHLGAVLKTGGAIASHNSRPENRVPEHDGLRRLVQGKITAPYDYYENVRLVLETTFAIKC
jgi:hypothetical protein